MSFRYCIAAALAVSLTGCYLTLDQEALDAKAAGDPVDTGPDESGDAGAPEFTTSLDTPPIELDFDGPTTRDPCVATTQQARQLLTTYCGECHAPPGGAGGFSTILDWPVLVNARSSTARDPNTNEFVRLLVPGEPAQSRLYLRALSGEMPPRRDPALPQLRRPTTSGISVLNTWISSCLTNYASAPAQ